MTSVATLSMYDWPEQQTYSDQFWGHLREALRQRDFDAPETLERGADPQQLWLAPNLVLGQACGLPYTQLLRGKVSLVGTPAYDIDCGAGAYYSVLVVREDNPAQGLADLSGGTLAVNDRMSQSGHAAVLHALSQVTDNPAFFEQTLVTGAHRASIQAVAAGKADIAGIDAVTWELAKRYEPAVRDLRVLARTEPTPGLPYITAPRPQRQVDRIHRAVIEAMAALDEETREALLLIGFSTAENADYDVIAKRAKQLESHFGPRLFAEP